MKHLHDDADIKAIADAIRLKRDIVDEMTVGEMPMQIGLIERNFPLNVLAHADFIISEKNAIGNRPIIELDKVSAIRKNVTGDGIIVSLTVLCDLMESDEYSAQHLITTISVWDKDFTTRLAYSNVLANPYAVQNSSAGEVFFNENTSEYMLIRTQPSYNRELARGRYKIFVLSF